jgi:signal transduction histidine kinase
MLHNEEDSSEDPMMKVEALKAEKRKLKAAITRQLHELAGRVAGISSGVEPRNLEEIEEIKATLERLEKIKEKTFEILEELRTLYQELKNTEMQVKVGDEADELNERIEREASAARRVLTSVSRTTRPVSPPSYSSNSNTSLPHKNGDSGVNNLERIRTPTFNGNSTGSLHLQVVWMLLQCLLSSKC